MRAVGIAITFLLYFGVAFALQQFKIFKLDCSAEPKYITNVTCKLKPLNRFKAVANMDCDIVRPLRNIMMHLQLFKKNSANQYKPYLINLTVNACNALDRNVFNIYTRLLWNILSQFTNVNHSCPFSGHLFARNGYLDRKNVPVTTPLGIYKIAFRFFEGYSIEELAFLALYVEVLEDTKLRENKIAGSIVNFRIN